MSINRCHVHDRNWDSDFHEDCPRCEAETPTPGDRIPERSEGRAAQVSQPIRETITPTTQEADHAE